MPPFFAAKNPWNDDQSNLTTFRPLLRIKNFTLHISWKSWIPTLQSLTGKVQVFYRDFPVYSFPLTCFGSVQGLKVQFSLKYREIHTLCTGISIFYLHSFLYFYNRDFPALRKTTTWNFAKTGKTLYIKQGKNVHKTGGKCNQSR